MMSSKSTRVRLLDPTVAVNGAVIPAASRLPTLDGAVLGLVNNGKTHGREILERVAHNLGTKYRLDGIRLVTKPHPSFPPREEDIEMLAGQAMAILAAIGD